MKKKGISLIVLIVTIIVIIILASSVILNLAQNNVIYNADEASFKTSTNEYNSGLNLEKISSLAVGNDLSKLEALSSNIKTYIPQISAQDQSKYCIQDGQLTYIGTDPNEDAWTNELNILNGNPPKIQQLHVPNIAATDEGFDSAVITNNNQYVTLTGMTVSSQRHSYVNLLDKNYNLLKRIDLYINNNTYLTEILCLKNGNIAVIGYTMDASYNGKAIMLLYSSNLDELKRVVYPAPKAGFTSTGRSIVATASGGYMVINDAEKLNSSNQIVDAFASIYSYDENGNSILSNLEARGLDGSLFMLYDAVLSPNGNVYLCGNNYKNGKVTPNLLGVNSQGQVTYEYILNTTYPYGEYRYMSVLSDGTLVLDRILCSSTSGNPYDTAKETIDYLNVTNNNIKNVDLGISIGLPKILDINTGYNDNIFVISLDISETSSGIYKYQIFKLSRAGDVRWEIDGKQGQTNVALKLFYTSNNQYIVFGQYKETTSSPYASYVTELVP